MCNGSNFNTFIKTTSNAMFMALRSCLWQATGLSLQPLHELATAELYVTSDVTADGNKGPGLRSQWVRKLSTVWHYFRVVK